MADEIVTLLGDTRPPVPVPEETHARLVAQLAEARERWAERPYDPDALIWVGRRTAYLGDYRKAITVFTEGIDRWPDDARFYRHRGHRRITLRQFAEAAADFEQAVRLIAGTPDASEPDGQPNARDIPTSTLHFNIWYHLGLARYLRGEMERALSAYWAAYAVSVNPDALVAATHWLYMTLRRLGRDDEAEQVLAPITEDLDVIENGVYHRLLLLYQGVLPPESLVDAPSNSNATLHDGTAGYGIGNWHLYNGRTSEATAWFRRVYAGPQWAAFGFIAAEVELAPLHDGSHANSHS
ncbi:MAG: tetratricopeptide repeat protein [Dehalococcoidia bacterium]